MIHDWLSCQEARGSTKTLDEILVTDDQVSTGFSPGRASHNVVLISIMLALIQ